MQGPRWLRLERRLARGLGCSSQQGMTPMEPVFRGRLWRPPSPEHSRVLVAAATADVAAAAAEKIQSAAERRRRLETHPLVTDQHEVQARRAQKVGKELLAYRQRMFVRGSRHSVELQDESNAGRHADIARTDLDAKLERLIAHHDVMLFMKGTPDNPRCGLSGRAVALLRDAQIDFDSVDILQEEDVRQRLKALSGYPTYPQFYHRGRFVGGLAAIQRLQASGALAGVLSLPAGRSASSDTALSDAALPPLSPPWRARRGALDETAAAEAVVRLTIVGEGRLGLSLGPSVDHSESMLQVKAVAPDGLAAAAAAAAGHAGRLAGLVLSEVMGQPTAGMDHRTVLKRIKCGPRPLSLVFTNAPVLCTTLDERSDAVQATALQMSTCSAAAFPDGVSITWGKCGHMFYTDVIKRWIAMNGKANGTDSRVQHTCPTCAEPWELGHTEQLNGAELQQARAEMTDVTQANWARRRRGGPCQLLLSSAGADASGEIAEYLQRNASRQKGKNTDKLLEDIEHISDKRWNHMNRRRGKQTVCRDADSSSPYQNASVPADGTAGLSIAYRSKLQAQVTAHRQAASLETEDLEYLQGKPPQVKGGAPCLTVVFSSRGLSEVFSNPPDPATGKVGRDKLQAAGLQQMLEKWGPFGLQVRIRSWVLYWWTLHSA